MFAPETGKQISWNSKEGFLKAFFMDGEKMVSYSKPFYLHGGVVQKWRGPLCRSREAENRKKELLASSIYLINLMVGNSLSLEGLKQHQH